jgi:hypothetical protein
VGQEKERQEPIARCERRLPSRVPRSESAELRERQDVLLRAGLLQEVGSGRREVRRGGIDRRRDVVIERGPKPFRRRLFTSCGNSGRPKIAFGIDPDTTATIFVSKPSVHLGLVLPAVGSAPRRKAAKEAS